MEDKRTYTTDELVRLLEEFGTKPVPLFHAEIEAIIATLRSADQYEAWLRLGGEAAAALFSKIEKADKLCEAMEAEADDLSGMGFEKHAERIHKAIADYEGK